MVEFDDEWIIVHPAETIDARRLRKSTIGSYELIGRYVYINEIPWDKSRGIPVYESLEELDRMFGRKTPGPYQNNLKSDSDVIQKKGTSCANCIHYNEQYDRCSKHNFLFDELKPIDYICKDWS